MGILRGPPEKFSAAAQSLSFELRTAGRMPKGGGIFINTHQDKISSIPPGIELTLLVGSRTGLVAAYALPEDRTRVVLYAEAKDLPAFQKYWESILPELRKKGC